ncbi:hypothetical protein JYU34_003516 [Plutella xylostella]|uniref:HMG box domain-containing protein n=1 Tax=Plutella xylostella TaxID=51655 RepID=A0ABQ7R091_PLUXY|nr:hypothetical protein JYU34_003516 [Plutella xylostella]
MNSKMQVPTTAQEYYLELYVRKHKSTLVGGACSEDIKKDGINSWKTLEPLDREIITNKFNKATAAYQNKFASYLQQSASARVTNENIKGCNTIPLVNTTNIVNTSMDSNENCNTPMNNSMVNYDNDNFINEEDIHIPEVDHSDQDHTLQHNYLPPLMIPQPPESPKVLKAKDLYEKIYSMNENATPYSALNRDDKRFYQNALLMVKRKYLKRYESYLLGLRNDQLYRHMHNVISEEIYE